VPEGGQALFFKMFVFHSCATSTQFGNLDRRVFAQETNISWGRGRTVDVNGINTCCCGNQQLVATWATKAEV